MLASILSGGKYLAIHIASSSILALDRNLLISSPAHIPISMSPHKQDQINIALLRHLGLARFDIATIFVKPHKKPNSHTPNLVEFKSLSA